MYFLVIVLLVAAAILFFYSFKNAVSRWAIFSIICGSCGGLSIILGRTILPSMDKTFLEMFLMRLTDILVFVSQTGFYYGFLMFSIVYANVFLEKTKQNLLVVLLIPHCIMLFVTRWEPYIKINYRILLLWVFPYAVCSIFLLLYSFFKEVNQYRKKNRFVILIIVLPTLLANLILNNIAKALYPEKEFLQYLPIFIGYSFFMFIVSMFIQGVLGIKLGFQKQLLDQTIRAVSSGTAMLNHTIKNELSKISVCMDGITSLAGDKNPQANEYIDIITNSTNHMLAMVERIQEQMKDIKYVEKPQNLVRLIEQTLSQIKPYFEQKHIKVFKNFGIDVDLLCDSTHIQEVLNNIIKNAVEAIHNERGEIIIELYSHKKNITLAIKDNGSGISKENLSHVFTPFFTTKPRGLNFGLGLCYCYNVMQASGGSLEIQSEVNVGTTLFLHFSSKKVIRIANSPLIADLIG